MIIVTPRLVQPVSDISKLRTPIDGLRTPNDIEEFLGGMIEGRPIARSHQGLDLDMSRQAFDKNTDAPSEAGGKIAEDKKADQKKAEDKLLNQKENLPASTEEMKAMGGLAAQYGFAME